MKNFSGNTSNKALSFPNSLDEIDETLIKLSSDEPLSLELSSSELSNASKTPLLESSLIQWISTLWGFSKSSFTLNQPIQAGHWAQLASSPASTVIALHPPGKLKDIDRRAAALFKKQYFENQNKWPDLAVSESAFILCLDSYSSYGLPLQLYPDQLSSNVTNWDGFRLFLDKLLNSIADESEIRGEIQGRANSLSTILFELFKNTHDHARLNVDGSVISESIRGIYSRFYPSSQISEYLGNQTVDSNPLDNYLRSILKPAPKKSKWTPSKRDVSGFLELTIFDTGPGMAAKWIGTEIENHTQQEQYDAVINCLKKGNSSTTSGTRGFGLWRVLQELIQVKGFIRIRTNKVHVFRQYASLEKLHMIHHPDGHETPQERFTDWKKQFTSHLSDYPNIKGTAISIVIPLGAL
ncbi:MAG: hypothetical protein KJ850_11410 [Gammaproteobacteria bacterium]|nr:hypothetical protein [Gammaproteobacteria bacterium]MBU1625637.1 hypothetical protein [Gammaproteobacteria bacterium]MBU1980897.1 hypothetical protein [Gammaproteobacteria bacterium]